MKNARPQQIETSAKDTFHFTAGILPTRTNIALAGVLAELLEGHTLTGMDVVFKQYTNRAAAVIRCLEVRYAWNIARRDIAIRTRDGRITQVTAYWMNIHVREAAFKAGARAWIAASKPAAKKRSNCAKQAKSRSATRNTQCIDPRQFDLFDGLM